MNNLQSNRNRNILLVILAVLGGLLLGYVVFGGNNSSQDEEHLHSTEQATAKMWTCSMHPQIMQPEPGDCPICGMDLIPAEVSSGEVSAEAFELSETALALADIQTTVVGEEPDDKGELVLSGKIMENEEATSVQVAYFAGRIERLNVNFTGEEIRKGSQLATIYSPELVSAQQELLTAKKLQGTQPELYKAVRNKLKLWKLTENQITAIETSGKVRENFPVYSTVSGIVAEKLVSEGDYVKQGQPLFKVSNLSTVWAVFDAYENQISLIKEGQDVNITSTAHPNKVFKGPITFISPVLNTQTRTINVRVTLPNKEQLFKPGMFVKGKIENVISSVGSDLYIPYSAVLWTGERSIVYVKAQSSKPVFELREVELGPRAGELISVISGLENGDEIVTQGTFTVDAAAQLQGKKSMMNSSGGPTSTGHEGHGSTGDNDFRPGSSSADASTLPVTTKVNAASDQFAHIVSEYIALKDALVRDNAEEARSAADGFLGKLKRFDHSTLKGAEKHDQWVSWEASARNSAETIAGISDIQKQREQFIKLSETIITGVKTFGNSGRIYKMYCPMADDNNGAYWLSFEEEVLNPYFGSSMLTCGKITETL